MKQITFSDKQFYDLLQFTSEYTANIIDRAVDYDDDRKNGMTTSILYMNTNNGGTKFEDGTFVNSVSNRMVTFDCSIKHAPVSCTDVDRRIVVNINYSKIKK